MSVLREASVRSDKCYLERVTGVRRVEGPLSTSGYSLSVGLVYGTFVDRVWCSIFMEDVKREIAKRARQLSALQLDASLALVK